MAAKYFSVLIYYNFWNQMLDMDFFQNIFQSSSELLNILEYLQMVLNLWDNLQSQRAHTFLTLPRGIVS